MWLLCFLKSKSIRLQYSITHAHVKRFHKWKIKPFNILYGSRLYTFRLRKLIKSGTRRGGDVFCSGSPGRSRKCEESEHNFRLCGLMLREKFGRGEQSFQFKSTDILLRMHSTQMGWEAICPNFITEFCRIFSWHCPFSAVKLPSSNYYVHSQECTIFQPLRSIQKLTFSL